MHPQMGIPILYYDQLNVIAKHITDIKVSLDKQGDKHNIYLQSIMPTISTIKSSKNKTKLPSRILKVQKIGKSGKQPNIRNYNNMRNKDFFPSQYRYHQMSIICRSYGHTSSRTTAQEKHEHRVMDPQEYRAQLR